MTRALKGIAAVLTSRWFWSLAGALILSALVWWFGDLLALGELRPFATDVAKLLAILVIAVVWGLSNLWAQFRARRGNDALVHAIAAPAKPAPGSQEVDELARRFATALDALRTRRFGRRGDRRWLYQLPWYVMIGPPGSGKTTALVQSGLRFPLAEGAELRGVGGTRYCDWFFTDEAVLIDTAGRYTTQDSDPSGDAAAWTGFLDLLRKHRPRQPLNGVLVALSVRDLLDRSGVDHGQAIRARLDELQSRLGVRLPVYLLLTKADLVAGFVPFFADLDESQRAQVWGHTLPGTPGEEPRLDRDGLGAALDQLVERLDARVPARLIAERSLERRAQIFAFPAQVRTLREEILRLAGRIFAGTTYGPGAPWLRGVYLTSGTQAGSPIDRLSAAIARSVGLPTEAPVAQAGDRSFFLTRLLRDVVFGEASLVGRDIAAERREGWLRTGAVAGLAAVAVLAIGGWTWSYVQNRDRQLVVEAELAAWARDAAPVARDRLTPADTDLRPVLPLLDRLRASEASLLEPEPVALRLGLSQRARTAEQIGLAYDDALQDVLLPRLGLRLERDLLRSIDEPEIVLEGLKVYLMLGGQAPVDPELIEGWFTLDLEREAAGLAEPMAVHLATLAQDLPGYERRAALDGGLIARARTTLTRIPLAKRAYDGLIASREVRDLPGWRVTDHAGPQAAATLVRRSGQPLDAPVLAIFTHAGFHEVLLPLLDETARAALAEDWVLASGAGPKVDDAAVAALREDMLKLYYDDAIAAWDGLLRDVTLVPLASLDQAVEATKALSGPSSPVKLLVQGIVAETALTVPPPAEDAAAGADPATLAATAAKAAGKLGAKLGKLTKLAGKLGAGPAAAAAPAEPPGAPVERHFAYLKALVEGENGAPPALDEAIAALATLHGKLAEAALSANPAQAFVQIGPTGAAQLAQAAGRLPEPLNGMLAGVAQTAQGMSAGGIRRQLNALWQTDIAGRCRDAIAGRFPFDPSSPTDANLDDVVQVFAPGGLIDGFVKGPLAPYVDTTRRPWRDSQKVGLASGALAALERARRITLALFATGGAPRAGYSLTPLDLDGGSASVQLDLDGQALSYAHGPARPQAFTWPGPGGTNVVRIAFAPLGGGPPAGVSKEGTWSLFRLFRDGELRSLGQPDLYEVSFAHAGHAARFRLKAGSVENPFDLRVLAGFTCPGSL